MARSPTDATMLENLVGELRATSERSTDSDRCAARPRSAARRARVDADRPPCSLDGLSGDLALPLKATLSRTYLLTKIEFLRGFVKATSALGEENRPRSR